MEETLIKENYIEEKVLYYEYTEKEFELLKNEFTDWLNSDYKEESPVKISEIEVSEAAQPDDIQQTGFPELNITPEYKPGRKLWGKRNLKQPAKKKKVIIKIKAILKHLNSIIKL